MTYTAEQYREYAKTSKAVKRYRNSAKAVACRKRYNSTDKGKQARRAADLARKSRAVAIITKAKNQPCADCGNKFPLCCMSFHHVHGPKLFDIGKNLHRTTSALVREIAKCVVLCANCHCIRHDAGRR